MWVVLAAGRRSARADASGARWLPSASLWRHQRLPHQATLPVVVIWVGLSWLMQQPCRHSVRVVLADETVLHGTTAALPVQTGTVQFWGQNVTVLTAQAVLFLRDGLDDAMVHGQ